MQKRHLITLLAGSLALAGLAGCDRTNDAGTAGDRETLGERVDRTTDNVGAKLDRAGETMSEKAAQAGDAVEDAAITTSIKTAMLAEPGLKALEIDVDTNEGTVTLTGTVDTPENRDRAVEIAQSTKGVRYVDDRLTVLSAG